jgi:hypothetical protein
MRVEGVGHKLYMDNFFSPDISDGLYTRDINCHGTVRQNHKGMPEGSSQEDTKSVV